MDTDTAHVTRVGLASPRSERTILRLQLPKALHSHPPNSARALKHESFMLLPLSL